MNAPIESLTALPWPLRNLIAQAITGLPDVDDIFQRSFEATIADLEMLSQAVINNENDAVTDMTREDYTEQLYKITRRAKATLELARMIDEADAAEERAKERRDG